LKFSVIKSIYLPGGNWQSGGSFEFLILYEREMEEI